MCKPRKRRTLQDAYLLAWRALPKFRSDSKLSTWLVRIEKTLDRFIAKPLAVVPGSTMTYDGVPDAKDRSDLIAYIKRMNRSPACGK